MAVTAGYDIGGAHLKVALVDDGRVILARQLLCPLWRGIEHLDAALSEARDLSAGATSHAVTMTGELADVFPDRYTGVARIIERAGAALGPTLRVWMGQRGFGSAAEAEAHWLDTASANYLATATLAARLVRSGLLIDMGSTTTDIIRFQDGRVMVQGTTDGERLRTGELVYTGLTRTPVAMVSQRGLFKGEWQGLAREAFATMADVRRVLGTLPDGADLHGTADGRGASFEESSARLARVFGRDADEGSAEDWQASAREIEADQMRSIADAVRKVVTADEFPRGTTLIAAGVGCQAALLAGRSIFPEASASHAHFGQILLDAGRASAAAMPAATYYAPAVAVALLVAET